MEEFGAPAYSLTDYFGFVSVQDFETFSWTSEDSIKPNRFDRSDSMGSAQYPFTTCTSTSSISRELLEFEHDEEDEDEKSEVLDELDEIWDNSEETNSSVSSSMSIVSTDGKSLRKEGNGAKQVLSESALDGESCSDSSTESIIANDTKSQTIISTKLPSVIVLGTGGKKLHPADDKNAKLPSWDRLRASMKQSRLTQEMLQEHDRRQGLPRSHCVTMMHTNRSRKQLEEGRILPKWNGKPLISKQHEQDGKRKKQTTARAA